jgi:TatD DNase family protein
MYVDVHCHLDNEYFEDKLDGVIERARKAGVISIITAGTNPESNKSVLRIAEKYDVVKAALGAYPLDILELKFDLDKEIEFIRQSQHKIIAISEVGLDFKFVKDKNEEQTNNFKKIIALAEEIKKPLIVHSRKAEKECIDLLRHVKVPVILHSFGGNKKLIQEAADLNFYFSVPPVIMRLQHFETLVTMVNINQLLTETDAPWLGPRRDEKNEPAFVTETIVKIAELKQLTVAETKKNIYLNYTRVFV